MGNIEVTSSSDPSPEQPEPDTQPVAPLYLVDPEALRTTNTDPLRHVQHWAEVVERDQQRRETHDRRKDHETAALIGQVPEWDRRVSRAKKVLGEEEAS